MSNPETFIPPIFYEDRELVLGQQSDFELRVRALGDNVYLTIIRNVKDGTQIEFESNQSLKEMRRVIDEQRKAVEGIEDYENASFYRDVVASITNNITAP